MTEEPMVTRDALNRVEANIRLVLADRDKVLSDLRTMHDKDIEALRELFYREHTNLRDLSDERVIMAKEALDAALASAEKAVLKAENSTNRRFDAVSEFQNALSNQTINLLSRTEYDAAHAALVARTLEITSRLDRYEGRSGGVSASWAFAAAAIGILTSVIAVSVAAIDFISGN